MSGGSSQKARSKGKSYKSGVLRCFNDELGNKAV